jgi:uncharacterized damage-inducible protein DinB
MTLSMLLKHNTWATRVLIERCRDLSLEQFHRQFQIGPGSLHATLLHVIGAMKRWADRVADREVRPSIEADTRPRKPDEMLLLLEEADRELAEAVTHIAHEERRKEIMAFERDPSIRFTRHAAIVHVLTHGMHHRAQVLNMMRQLGMTGVPDVDVIEWELRNRVQAESSMRSSGND